MTFWDLIFGKAENIKIECEHNSLLVNTASIKCLGCCSEWLFKEKIDNGELYIHNDI